MKPLFHKKQATNLIGMKSADFLTGDYRPYTISCTDGTAQIIGMQLAWVVRNFAKIDQGVGYKPKTTIVTQTLNQGDTFTFRQMAIRAYVDGHGMVLGDNDYYEQFMAKLYIRSKKGAVTFTPDSISDTYGTVALTSAVDNPTIDCAPPDYSYYPPIVAPVLIESQWKHGACKFYMTQAELEHASYTKMLLLAFKDSTIKIHGGTKTLQTEYIDADGNSLYASDMSIEDNELLQAITVPGMTAPKNLLMRNTPNVKYIAMGTPPPDLSEQSAQSIADVIAASTEFGTYVGSAGVNQEIITEAIDNNPYWSWA